MVNKMRMLYRYIKHGDVGNGVLAFCGLDSSNTYKCIICGDMVNRFYPYGVKDDFFSSHHVVGGGYRANCICLHCGCIDRTRWQYYTIKNHTDILTEQCEVLHIAPEKGIMSKITDNTSCKYYSGDIRPGAADHIVDLTNMTDIQDDCFDYVIVNHVMEHIPDEGRAFSEIHRVLKQGGKLVLSFPICMDQDTFEVEDIDTDEKRLANYGQKDHHRLYGRDYKERVESFGFRVEVFTPEKELSDEYIEKYGFIRNDIIMICTVVKQ